MLMMRAKFFRNWFLGSISSNLSAQHKAQICWSTAAQQVGQFFSTIDLTVLLHFWGLRVYKKYVSKLMKLIPGHSVFLYLPLISPVTPHPRSHFRASKNGMSTKALENKISKMKHEIVQLQILKIYWLEKLKSSNPNISKIEIV